MINKVSQSLSRTEEQSELTVIKNRLSIVGYFERKLSKKIKMDKAPQNSTAKEYLNSIVIEDKKLAWHEMEE